MSILGFTHYFQDIEEGVDSFNLLMENGDNIITEDDNNIILE